MQVDLQNVYKFQLCIRISMQLTLQELLKFVALFESTQPATK